MRINNSCNLTSAPSSALTYSQIVAVRGELRQILLRTEAIRDRPINRNANTLVFRGVGDYFPKIESLEWMAEADDPAPRVVSSAYDLSWLVELLLDESPIVFSSSRANDVEAWLKRKGTK